MVTKRLQYRYDAVGNKVGMTDADGGLFTYTYDVMRRLTGVINPVGERTTYVYDLNGRRTSVQLANGTRTSYSYDQGSRVQQIHTLKSNNSTVAKFDYAYDNNGRRTSVLEADGSRVTWTYDGTSQVTSEWRTGTSPFRHTFVYDTRGNRTLKIEDGARTTLVYDAANQLSWSEDAGGTTNYTYDANGNQHVTATPGGSRTTQVWDYENRLVKTLQPGGVFTMAYDADGLRVRKETPSETKLFVWDNQNYLAETDDTGVTEVAYTTEPSTYGSTISHRTGGATTTYHFDALAAARVLTNASETVLESYNYTAFGTILGTPTVLTPFLWGGLVGYYWDADLATQYIRARHYQPSIARWISLDPIGFAGGDANLFRYVRNEAILSMDPSGLATITDGIDCSVKTCVFTMHSHNQNGYPGPRITEENAWDRAANQIKSYCGQTRQSNNIVIISKISSPRDVCNAVRKHKCCQILMIGHAGGQPGAINAWPGPNFNKPVQILPNDATEGCLVMAIKDNNCSNSSGKPKCKIIISACNRPDLDFDSVRRDMANSTQCRVCGTTNYVCNGCSNYPINEYEFRGRKYPIVPHDWDPSTKTELPYYTCQDPDEPYDSPWRYYMY